ncbi:MAG: cation acetate symporter, partial [Planctomycetaceae bacterium]|nr:cation acetate symporter [Planctomycetaceae bacterium]
LESLGDDRQSTGPLGPTGFLAAIQQSTAVLWRPLDVKLEPGTSDTEATGTDATVIKLYVPKATHGTRLLRPGEHPTFAGIRSEKLVDKLNFLSLMIALFGGTASLPHILIRYYTVKDASAARKSTIVGIASIGFFYLLTLYIGLGAMTSGAIDVKDSNLAAPLLARSLSEWLFAAVSAIAFTTVLGTVSGLILASTGAITRDLFSLCVKEQV